MWICPQPPNNDHHPEANRMIVFMMQRTRPSNHVHTNSSLLGCMNPLPLRHQLGPNTSTSNIKAQPDPVFSPCKVHTQAQHFLHCSLRSGTAEEKQASPFTHLGPGWRKKTDPKSANLHLQPQLYHPRGGQAEGM